MQALRFERFGLDQLQLAEVPTPQPQDHEVLVRVLAAGINPSDVKNLQGMMADSTKPPRIPGRDFAGVIEAGPANCIGEAVWGTGGELGFMRDGTHAEYVVLNAEAVVPVPPKITPEQAAASGLSIVTAWAALFDKAELKGGETVLVIGANGAVGSMASQLAGWAGARVIGVDRSGDNRSRADVMVNSSAASFQQDLRDAVGEGVHVAIDTVGGPMFQVAMEALRADGRMVAITAPKDSQVCFDMLRFYRRNLSLLGLNTLAMDSLECASILRETSRAFETGWARPPELELHPLVKGVEAYQAAAKGGRKHVLRMGNPT